MHFSPLQLLLLLFPVCSLLPKPSAKPGAKVWALGCTSGLFKAVQSGAIVYSTCWHVPEWHLPFSQQYHIVNSCSIPAFLWLPDWFVLQPSPSAQLGFLLGTWVFLPECCPLTEFHPADFRSVLFCFIRAALNSSFISESAAQTSPASCCWKSFWSQDISPPQHSLTHQPCDPAREGNSLGLTQFALPKSTLAVFLPFMLSESLTVNNSAEYFSWCWASTGCFIFVHVGCLLLSKARYSAFPLG